MHLEQKEILIQIKDFEDRLSHMRDLLAMRQIDAEDYREIKSQYNMKISAFESQLTTLNNDMGNVQSLIEQGISKIMEISHNLENGGLIEIRNDIGSIYPEKMQFDNNGVRTTRRNDFIQYINLIKKKLGAKKNGTKVDFSTLSRQVVIPTEALNKKLKGTRILLFTRNLNSGYRILRERRDLFRCPLKHSLSESSSMLTYTYFRTSYYISIISVSGSLRSSKIGNEIPNSSS